MKKVLVVDDEKSIRKTVQIFLSDRGYSVDTASSGKEALNIVRENNYDLMLLDLKLPDTDGIELYHEIKKEGHNPIVIVITAHGSIESAVEAMRVGAYNYITKPLNMEILEMTMKEAFEKQELIEENVSLRVQLSSKSSFQSIVGKTRVMEKVFELTKQAAKSKSNVLILGETGTGKELISDAIHYNSPRRNQSWVKINCAALHENLLESELFGHEKGAFTDAKSMKKGRFELAHKGNILFDEIGSMSLPIQGKLLRVIEDQEVMRLGAQSPIKVDVRIISSTNEELEKAIKMGAFRKDLFYRIKVITIKLPPLRERKDDIPILVDFLIRKINKETGKDVESISTEATEILMEYDWPGNVRELENVIERAIALGVKEKIFPKHLPAELVERNKTYWPGCSDGEKTLKQVTYEAILDALEKTGGNRTKAAEILGVSREFIRRKMKEIER